MFIKKDSKFHRLNRILQKINFSYLNFVIVKSSKRQYCALSCASFLHLTDSSGKVSWRVVLCPHVGVQ